MFAILLSVLGIGGLGALTYFVGPAALFGFLKRIPLWAWVALAIGIAFMVTVHSRNHWKALAASRGDKLVLVCQATRDAAGRPRLACGQVPLQIKLLGKAVGDLKGAIGRQNAAVAALGAQTRQQQAQAAQATKVAQKRADKALATSQRLAASAARPPGPSAPCEPSEAVRKAWK
jgi:hypothetical protein